MFFFSIYVAEILPALIITNKISLMKWRAFQCLHVFICNDDDVALRCDSQFPLGDRLLVAPVLHQGARSRDVYLSGAPPVRWKDYFASDPSGQCRSSAWWNVDTQQARPAAIDDSCIRAR